MLLPKQLTAEELEDLIPRTRRLALLGRYKTAARDLNLAWDGAEDYGESVSACTFAVMTEL
jgi:hypothetical protein